MKQKGNTSKKSASVQKNEKGTEKQTLYFSIALLFVASTIYFYFFGHGLFIYQENKFLFIYSKDYLTDFLVKPGGFIEYAGSFLMQAYHSYAGGTLLISLFPVLLAVVLLKIIRRLTTDKSFFLPFILFPSCLLLLLETHYDYFLHQNLGFLIVLFWFYFSVISDDKIKRFLPLVLFPLLYYLAGTFAAIYLALYIIYSIIFEKGITRFIFPATLIAVAFLTCIVFKEILFLQPVSVLLGNPVFTQDLSKFYLEFYIICGYLIFIPLIAKVSVSQKIKRNQKLYRFTTISAIFPATIIFLIISYNREKTYLMHFEKLVYNQEWREVIRLHEKSPSKTLQGQYYYNLALSEEEQLCSRLFFGQQDFGYESLFIPISRENVGKKALLYYCIGLVGEASRLAYESMVINGYQPENLKLIIKLELINGNYEVAERYINKLKKTLFYRKWAEKYERMLFNRKLILADRELGRKIRFIPEKDFFVASSDIKNIDLALLMNPANIKAFEYKMAWLILKKDFREVVAQVKRMKNMGYKSIPRHIEETIVLFADYDYELPYLGGLGVNPETVIRFREFETLKNQNSKVTKKQETTFWYYFQYK